MYLEKKLEKKWLIKSENRILGPYNFEQIIDLLRKKQISIIDEVRDPETRWLYVRENNEFKTIVEEIRKEIDSKQESTKTYQSSAGTNTSTSTQTVPFEDISQKTRTDIIREDTVTLTREIESFNETYTAKPETAQVKIEKAKMYGVHTDASVKSKLLDYSNRLRLIIAMIVVFVVCSYGGYIYFQKRNILKREEELVLLVKRYKYLGIYDKSAEVYETLPDSSKRKLLPDLLDIYPLLEKAGVVKFEEIKALKSDTSLDAATRSHIELIHFWQAVKQQNYGQAQDFLAKASGLQAASILIKENDALLSLKKRNFIESYAQFKKIFEREKNGRYLYGMVLSYIGLPEIEKTVHRKELLLAIERYTTVFFDFRKELLLAQVYLARESGDEPLYRFSLKHFFNTPVQLSKMFSSPNLLVPDVYNWKDLGSVKLSIQSRLGNDESHLFQLHDLLELGQLSAATDYLINNQAKIADLQIKQQMNLLLMHAQGRSKEALALGQAKNLNMDSELNHLLLAQSSIRSDPKRNVADHLNFLQLKKYIFYKEWLELEQMIARKNINELRAYLKEHFITIENFNPVFEARDAVNQ